MIPSKEGHVSDQPSPSPASITPPGSDSIFPPSNLSSSPSYEHLPPPFTYSPPPPSISSPISSPSQQTQIPSLSNPSSPSQFSSLQFSSTSPPPISSTKLRLPQTNISHPRKKFIALGVALILIFTSYIVILQYAGSAFDDAEIIIEEIRIHGTDNDSLSIELTAILTNPSSFSATVKESDLELLYQDEKAAEFTIPSLNLDSGENLVTLDLVLKESEGSGLEDLANDLLKPSPEINGDASETGLKPQVRIRGTLEVEKWISFAFKLDKIISLEGFGDFNVEIQSVTILDSSQNNVTGMIIANVTNPSKVGVNLSLLDMDVLVNGSQLAMVSSQNFLEPGVNTLSLGFILPSTNQETARNLMSRIVDGADETLEIMGNRSSGTLLSRLSSSFSYQYKDTEGSLGSINDLIIGVESISLQSTSPEGMFGEAITSVTNPSMITIPLQILDLELLYQQEQLAILRSEGTLTPGDNYLTWSFFIPAQASVTYNGLIEAILNGEETGFEIRLDRQDDSLLSTITQDLVFFYHLQSAGGIETTVTLIDIQTIGLFSSRIGITATVINPTPVTADLSNFDFTTYYEGRNLGPLAIANPIITPGTQSMEFALSISTISLRNLELISKLIAGDPIEIVIRGSHGFNAEHALEFYLSVVIGTG